MRKFLALAVPVLVLAFVLAKIGVNQENKEGADQAATEQQAQAEGQANPDQASTELAANAEDAAAQNPNAEDAATAENTEAQPAEASEDSASNADQSAADTASADVASSEAATAQPASSEEIPAISEEELVALFKNTTSNLVVLDTRSEEAFDQSRLIGSVSAPEGNIAKEALRNVLGEQASVVILCEKAECDAVKKISDTAAQAQIDKNKFRTFTTENLNSLEAKGLTIKTEDGTEGASRS